MNIVALKSKGLVAQNKVVGLPNSLKSKTESVKVAQDSVVIGDELSANQEKSSVLGTFSRLSSRVLPYVAGATFGTVLSPLSAVIAGHSVAAGTALMSSGLATTPEAQEAADKVTGVAVRAAASTMVTSAARFALGFSPLLSSVVGTLLPLGIELSLSK